MPLIIVFPTENKMLTGVHDDIIHSIYSAGNNKWNVNCKPLFLILYYNLYYNPFVFKNKYVR